MATTLKQTEAVPASYPDAPAGLSTAAAALDADMIWIRIESYIAHRFTSRAIVWTVEGPDEWTAPLTPATITTVEVWQADAWQAVTLSPSPMGGYVLPGCGPYRFTGTVGAGVVPAAVSEAFKRLAEYSAEISDFNMMKGRAGVSSHSVELGSSIKESFDRAPTWVARAMINSGAADLLRPYRRA